MRERLCLHVNSYRYQAASGVERCVGRGAATHQYTVAADGHQHVRYHFQYRLYELGTIFDDGAKIVVVSVSVLNQSDVITELCKTKHDDKSI